MEKEKDVQEVIKDLQHIKEAMARSNSVVKFMDMDSTLKGVLLLSGLMVILFAAIFYYFILSYGTFGEIPVNIKVLLFALLAVSLALVIKLKASNLLQKARQMKAGSTFFSLAKEIYTPAFTSMMLPFFVTLAVVVIYLSLNGHYHYLVPSLSILFGLLYTTFLGSLLVRYLLPMTYWLVLTGLFSLFIADWLHPMGILALTFGGGFLLGGMVARNSEKEGE